MIKNCASRWSFAKKHNTMHGQQNVKNSHGVIGKKKKGLNIFGSISTEDTLALPCTFITYCDLLLHQIPLLCRRMGSDRWKADLSVNAFFFFRNFVHRLPDVKKRQSKMYNKLFCLGCYTLQKLVFLTFKS